jgi:hypothetical protein
MIDFKRSSMSEEDGGSNRCRKPNCVCSEGRVEALDTKEKVAPQKEVLEKRDLKSENNSEIV